MANQIISQWGGQCSSCEEYFPPGTLISDSSGGWSHESCPNPPPNILDQGGVMCDTCFTYRSKAGKCLCDVSN